MQFYLHVPVKGTCSGESDTRERRSGRRSISLGPVGGAPAIVEGCPLSPGLEKDSEGCLAACSGSEGSEDSSFITASQYSLRV